MKADAKRVAVTVLGAVLCIAPPAVATLCCFPVWVEKSSTSTVSGLSLFFLLLCIIPLFKMAKTYLSTPSAPMVWAAVFLFSIMFRTIIDQMCMIALVGVASSVLGAFVFKVRDKKFPKNDSKKETE